MTSSSSQVTKVPTILMIHGHGTNSTIFQLQTRRLVQSLKSHFRFLFVDAPFPSLPGPGVAPLFADLSPFSRWHCDANTLGQFDITAEELDAEQTATREMFARHIEKVVTEEGGRVAGVMAFSQGTRVATGLMMDEVFGVGGLLSGILFAVLFCGTFPVLRIRDGKVTTTEKEGKLAVRSVHVQGSVDPWAAEGTRLMETYFERDMARTVKFNGGHQVPTGTRETGEIVELVMEAWRANQDS
ncbi:Serine hydrolase FSH [Rhypophila decipiens]